MGINTAKETSRSALSVLNDNTYDVSTNIMIGINDTVPLGGITLTDSKPVTQHGQVSTEQKIKNYDPYGLGLSEKELTYVTIENKLILIEVSTMYVFQMFIAILIIPILVICFIVLIVIIVIIVIIPNIIMSNETFFKCVIHYILLIQIILYYIM